MVVELPLQRLVDADREMALARMMLRSGPLADSGLPAKPRGGMTTTMTITVITQRHHQHRQEDVMTAVTVLAAETMDHHEASAEDDLVQMLGVPMAVDEEVREAEQGRQVWTTITQIMKTTCTATTTTHPSLSAAVKEAHHVVVVAAVMARRAAAHAAAHAAVLAVVTAAALAAVGLVAEIVAHPAAAEVAAEVAAVDATMVLVTAKRRRTSIALLTATSWITVARRFYETWRLLWHERSWA